MPDLPQLLLELVRGGMGDRDIYLEGFTPSELHQAREVVAAERRAERSAGRDE